MRDKYHMIISIYTEKELDKSQHPFIIETINKVDIGETYLNIIKVLNYRHTANTIFNSNKLKHLLLRLGTRQGCPLLPFLFNIVFKVLASAIKQGNK